VRAAGRPGRPSRALLMKGAGRLAHRQGGARSAGCHVKGIRKAGVGSDNFEGLHVQTGGRVGGHGGVRTDAISGKLTSA